METSTVVVVVVAGMAAVATLVALAMLRRERGRMRAERHSWNEEAADTARELRTRIATATTALDSLSDGVVVFAPDGRVLLSNPAAHTHLGRRFGSIDEVTPASLRERCTRATRGDPSTDLEFETAGRLMHASALSTDDGGGVLVLRDVTNERRSARVRQDFVANASHELKTPVSSIVALAEALSEAAGKDETAATRFLELLQQESQRLSRLVAELLDLSRLEAAAPEMALVRLNGVIEEEVERSRPEAEAAGLRMILEPVEGIEVLGSEGDLALLVHNLLDNAIRFTPRGGEVRVSVTAHDGEIVLRVSDTGIGISSGDVERIFERFYRVDPARSRQTGGTGLGLSIVRHVAEGHGGSVSVRSVLGAGSTFVVRLPLSSDGG